MSIIDSLNYENLLPKQRELADLVGFDVFIHLVKNCGGSSLYIPKQDTIELQERNVRIKTEFDGGNYRQLSQKYGVTDTWIRNIVSGKECSK